MVRKQSWKWTQRQNSNVCLSRGSTTGRKNKIPGQRCGQTWPRVCFIWEKCSCCFVGGTATRQMACSTVIVWSLQSEEEEAVLAEHFMNCWSKTDPACDRIILRRPVYIMNNKCWISLWKKFNLCCKFHNCHKMFFTYSWVGIVFDWPKNNYDCP